MCAYNNPPGNLTAKQIPQFVLVRSGGSLPLPGGLWWWLMGGVVVGWVGGVGVQLANFKRCGSTCVPTRTPRPQTHTTRAHTHAPPTNTHNTRVVQISHANALNVEDLGPGMDGNGWPASWKVMDKIVGGKKNKNGCPVPVTWCARRRRAALCGHSARGRCGAQPTPLPHLQVCAALPLAVRSGRPGARGPPRDCHAEQPLLPHLALHLHRERASAAAAAAAQATGGQGGAGGSVQSAGTLTRATTLRGAGPQPPLQHRRERQALNREGDHHVARLVEQGVRLPHEG